MIIQMTGSTRIICHLFIFCNCAGIAQDLYTRGCGHNPGPKLTGDVQCIQYDMSYSTVIQELGYPNNSKSLCYWFKEYESNGDFHKAYAGGSKYTDEQKQMAVAYYP